jgi:hypothetical protein
MGLYAKLPVYLGAFGMSCTMLHAAAPDAETHPYQAIPAANVFRLVQPVPKVAEAPPVILPRFRLAGITTFPRGKRILLEVIPVAGRNGSSKRESHILAQGERIGEIEVLEIDEKAGRVKLSYAGTPVSLSLEKDAPPAQAAPPTPPQPPTPNPVTQPPHVPQKPHHAQQPEAPQAPEEPPLLQ